MPEKKKAIKKRKYCPDCKRNRSLTFFTDSAATKYTENPKFVRNICIECHQKQVSLGKYALKKKLNAYKKEKKCARCGFDDPRALHFHHLDPKNKKRSVSNMVSMNYSWKSIAKEIEKCEVLCANCHAIIHSEEKEKHLKKTK